MGTDTGLIRVYNVDSKSIVQEFIMDESCPWVNQLSSSPTEPIFVCAGSYNKLHPSSTDKPGALVAWSMKSMSACVRSQPTQKQHHLLILVIGYFLFR